MPDRHRVLSQIIDLVAHDPEPCCPSAIQRRSSASPSPSASASTSHSTRSASAARASRAAHPFLLDRIVALADPGGVDHRHRIAVEIEMHFDDVARGAGMRRDDRHLAPRQLVHQASTCRHSAARRSPPPARRAAVRCGPAPPAPPRSRRADRSTLRQRRRHQLVRHVALVGKIDRRPRPAPAPR